LDKVLFGAPPTAELTNVAGLANVFGSNGNGQGLGGVTKPDVTTQGAGSVANLEDSSKDGLKNLLKPPE
jgi:hypothetical protein